MTEGLGRDCWRKRPYGRGRTDFFEQTSLDHLSQYGFFFWGGGAMFLLHNVLSFSVLLRHVDTVRFGGFMFTPLTPRKADLVRGLYFSPKTFDIVLKNLKSMQDWIETRDASLFGNIPHGTILIGARDLVLDRAAMLRSAQTAHPTWRVIETYGTSHFVSLDQPSAVPEFMAPASPAA